VERKWVFLFPFLVLNLAREYRFNYPLVNFSDKTHELVWASYIFTLYVSDENNKKLYIKRPILQLDKVQKSVQKPCSHRLPCQIKAYSCQQTTRQATGKNNLTKAPARINFLLLLADGRAQNVEFLLWHQLATVPNQLVYFWCSSLTTVLRCHENGRPDALEGCCGPWAREAPLSLPAALPALGAHSALSLAQSVLAQ